MKQRVFVYLLIFTVCFLHSIPSPVFGQGLSLAKEILTKYYHIFQREDIQSVLPDALKGLKAPYIQERINPILIARVIDDPDLLRKLLPDLDPAYITHLKQALKKENGELKGLLTDPLVQKVLQDPAAITEFQKARSDPAVIAEVQRARQGPALLATRRSSVAQDRVVFNEIRNAEADKNDWLELKNISETPVFLKNWEISIVIPSPIQMAHSGKAAGKDEDVVAFPDYVLPAGGILLIVNTDPSETDLEVGADITDPARDPKVAPSYLVAPKMSLPDSPYLLILRSATDKNGTPEAFEDLAGNYFRASTHYSTQVWPLKFTLQPPKGTETVLTQEWAWRRSNVDARGYFRVAWTPSRHQSGIGYKPDAAVDTSLGTPGYPNDRVVDTELKGRITFSELMFATNGGLFSQPQWIELYNNTPRAEKPVNLMGWKLVIEVRDTGVRPRRSTIELVEHPLASNGTILLVTRNRRHSKRITADQIYDLNQHQVEARKLGLRENTVLGQQGFALQLFSPDGTLVDTAGNLGKIPGRDPLKWELPSGRTEDRARTSMVRRYKNRKALDGTEKTSWIRAADMSLSVNAYYGHKTDIGTPGFRSGGVNPVVLSQFRASQTEAGVVLAWRTESELSNAGFNILRSQTAQGVFVKVNTTLVPGNGTTSERHTYTWTDTTAKPDIAYYYQLEEVSLSGDRRRLLRVRMRGPLSPSGKSIQKWADLKK